MENSFFFPGSDTVFLSTIRGTRR